MPSKQYYVFNSFSDQKFCGNPAGVVPDAQGLSTEQMQMIARQLNLVETVFVLPASSPDVVCDLRYFMPEKELPVAGHPTIAAWACLQHIKKFDPLPQSFMQNSGAGLIQITIDGSKIFTSQKPATITSPNLTWADVCLVVGLDESDIDKTYPLAMVDAGLGHLMFCVKSLKALMKMKFMPDELAVLCKKAGATEAQIFCFEAYQNDMSSHTRNLCPRFGLEDPACGNGNAALGAYFAEYVRPGEKQFNLKFEQGHIVKMPSVIEVRVNDGDIIIGGHAVLMQEGIIHYA